MEDLEKLIEELELDQDEIKPIERGQGLIAYRKYLWAIKFLQDKVVKLGEYRQQIVVDVDSAIESKGKQIQRLKTEIEKAIIADPAADRTKTGGKTLALPDIATVSLSKLSDKIVIDDPEEVLSELGPEFKKVKISLDVTKAKNHIKETGVLPKGVSKKQDRTLSIRFKR